MSLLYTYLRSSASGTAPCPAGYRGKCQGAENAADEEAVCLSEVRSQWRELLGVRSRGDSAPSASTARALAVRVTNSQAIGVAITFWILEL